MRALKGLAPALFVSGAFAYFLVVFLGAGWPFAIGSSAVIGLGILAVIWSRPTERDRLADEAWQAAAPDLPPASDRQALELAQEAMPGPEKKRAGARSQVGRDEATQRAGR